MKKINRVEKPNKKLLIILLIIILFIIVICSASQYVTNRWYIKVGDETITKSQYNMWQAMIVEEFFEEYGNYTSAMNIDSSKDLNDQEMSDGISWGEYFKTKTNMEIYTVLAALNEADKEKWNGNVSIDDDFNHIIEHANDAGVDFENYVKYVYSRNLTYDKAIEVLGLRAAATSYMNSKASCQISEEEYEAYYKSNNKGLDKAYAYVITLENTDENVSLLKDKMESINNEQEFIATAIELQGDNGYSQYDSIDQCPSNFSNWLFSVASEEMSSSISSDVCYLVWKIGQERNEDPTVNAYMTKFTGGEQVDNIAEAKEFISRYESGEQSKEAFISLVNEYSGDDGYIEGIIDYQISVGMKSWLFDSLREHGDVDFLTYGDDVYVFYWDSFGEPTWKVLSKEGIVAEKYDTIASDIRGLYSFIKR